MGSPAGERSAEDGSRRETEQGSCEPRKAEGGRPPPGAGRGREASSTPNLRRTEALPAPASQTSSLQDWREQISVVFSHSALVLGYDSPQTLMQPHHRVCCA